MRIQLLNMDDSLRAQTPFLEYCARRQAVSLDLLELGRKMRMWSGRRSMHEFCRKLDEARCDNDDEPALTFLGSGDFHHLSAALIGRLSVPVTVIHFDNHPDFIRLSARYHCASWVNRVLSMQHVRRVVTVGPCTDLAMPQLERGNLDALSSGRLELYPYRHVPSSVLGRFGAGPSYRQQGRRIHWRNLHTENWNAFWTGLLDRLPTQDVYVTIDKDVLVSQDAETNWDQGEMTLKQLLTALEMIAGMKRIVGVDVVGDYAPMTGNLSLRRFMAWLDHPGTCVDHEKSARVNSVTNIAIADTLLSAGQAGLSRTAACCG